MGANLALEQRINLTLNLNLCILVVVEVATSILFFRLTKMLNTIEAAPLLTVQEAMKQKNSFVLFKTNALINYQQAKNLIQLPLRRMQAANQDNNGQLIWSILRSKQLTQQQIRLYRHLDHRFNGEAFFNRYALFRALFFNSNLPKMYPANKNSHSFMHPSSVFFSQNMVTFARMDSKGKMAEVYLGFNRQFIIEIFRKQRQIVFLEFLTGFGMLFFHKQQISNFYQWLRRETLYFFKNLFRRKRVMEADIRKEETCIICYAARRDIVLRDCRHFILCSECTQTYNVTSCPMCRYEKEGRPIKVKFE